jgi:hypothetical protein
LQQAALHPVTSFTPNAAAAILNSAGCPCLQLKQQERHQQQEQTLQYQLQKQQLLTQMQERMLHPAQRGVEPDAAFLQGCYMAAVLQAVKQKAADYQGARQHAAASHSNLTHCAAA